MSLSRRSLLGGAAASTHIASLVVHCRPDAFVEVRSRIESLPNIEIPASNDSSKLVVLMEMTDESQLLRGISEIEALPGVVSATLVFHQVDQL